MWFKSVLVFAAFICLTQARSGDVPKGLETLNKNTAGEARGTPVAQISDHGYMGSLQQAPGRSCYGFCTIFVAASWAIQKPSVVDGLMNGGPRNVKKIVIVTGTLDPAHEGKVHRIKKIVEVSNELGAVFVLLKTSDEVHPWVKIAPSSYSYDGAAPATFLYWARYQDSLNEDTTIAYDDSTTGGAGTSTEYYTATVDSEVMDIGCPMLEENDLLMGLLTDGNSGDYETFDFVPAYRYEILQAIKDN